MTPVERFVREVLPLACGPRQVPSALMHVPLIQDAAKDRGLSSKKVGDTTYFYDGRLAVGGVHKHRMTTLVGREAITICDSKAQTKQMLQAAGLPTPSGIVLGPDRFNEALAHVLAAGPSALKPSYGMRGRGVTCGIATEEELRAAWETAGRAVTERSPLFVLEEQIEGIDIRVFVVGRRVVAAATRLPAHVVGDGQRSIATLIELKQQRRLENAYLAGWHLTVDTALLARTGRTLADIPATNEVVVLNGVANMETGGENVDVTELVHPDLMSLAVEATRALPGLRVAGVDLMAPDLGSVDGAVILELNAGANIGLHHCPAYGRPRDVAGAIVDEMIASSGARRRLSAESPDRLRT